MGRRKQAKGITASAGGREGHITLSISGPSAALKTVRQSSLEGMRAHSGLAHASQKGVRG